VQTGLEPPCVVSFRENHWPGLADHRTVAALLDAATPSRPCSYTTRWNATVAEPGLRSHAPRNPGRCSRVPQPAGGNRHHHPRRQARLPRLRRAGRVRTRPHPGADQRGAGRGQGPRPPRRPTFGAERAQGSRWPRRCMRPGSTWWPRSPRRLGSAAPRSTVASPSQVANQEKPGRGDTAPWRQPVVAAALRLGRGAIAHKASRVSGSATLLRYGAVGSILIYRAWGRRA
jgi:hypothetical protein